MASYNGTENEHRSFHDLERLLRKRFEERANQNRLDAAARNHFRIHCLKYDLEGLLLATPDALRQRLGTSDALRGQWRQPVEDQNDTKPPKRIVEDLFRRYRKRPGYLDTVDAPWILKRASLETIVGACPQRFGPFVSDLRVLAGGRDPVTQAPETIRAAKSGSPSSDG